MKTKLQWILVMTLFMVMAGANCGKNPLNPVFSPGPVSLILPFPSSADANIQVDNVFAPADAPNLALAPFGEHLGMHFSPLPSYSGNMPYYAMADGIITTIQSGSGGEGYNVNIGLKVSDNQSVLYQFEPEVNTTAVQNTQFSMIAVTLNQSVTQGQLIGNLYQVVGSGNNPILHIGVLVNNIFMCPMNYMTSDSAVRAQSILIRDHPSWLACYANQ